jgi:hypothetical protein
MTLTEFLLARITEDEAKVQHMQREKVRAETAPIFAANPPGWLAGVDIFVSPTRWAAECEAKRRIVGLWDLRMSEPDDWFPSMPLGGEAADVYYAALRLLASVYADHPDFDPGWAL